MTNERIVMSKLLEQEQLSDRLCKKYFKYKNSAKNYRILKSKEYVIAFL
jgi:hypothetical protein